MQSLQYSMSAYRHLMQQKIIYIKHIKHAVRFNDKFFSEKKTF